MAVLTGTKLSYQFKFKCKSSQLILTSKCSQLKCPSNCIYILYESEKNVLKEQL